MATTCIWPVRGKIGKLIVYAENPEKTWNPEAFAYTQSDIDGMRDVVDYAMNNYDRQDDSLRRVMEYASNAKKTEQQYFVSGINCNTACARQQMRDTKAKWGKTGGIVAYHAYQSFAPGEVSPGIAHEIGVKLAQELWGERFEVIVCTHVNTGVVHNHFVLNSVSLADGKRYYDNKKTYAHLRSVSDRLCREYGLSVVKEPKGRGKAYAEWQAEKGGKPTMRGIIRQDVDRAIRESMTWSAFLNNLRKQGYTIKTGVKHLAVRPPGKDRFVRIRSLGEQYEEEAIKQRILKQRVPSRPKPPTYTARRTHFRGTFGFTLHKVTWKSLRALYYHYLRILREAQARSPIEEPAPFAVREDILSYQELREQVSFLHRHKFDTTEQVLAYREQAEREATLLAAERKELHNEKRRVGTSPEQKEALREKTNTITARITELRRDIGLCNAIYARSMYLHERYTEARRQLQNEMRMVKDEPNRRRSGSGSTDGHDCGNRNSKDGGGLVH